MTIVPDTDDALASFEREVLPHVDRLFRLAMWFERSRTEAEDRVEDTIMQAWQSFHRVQPRTDCRAWLVTVLLRIVSERRRVTHRSPLRDPDDRIMRSAPRVPPVCAGLTDDHFLESLRRLPMPLQEVIVLCDVEELSCQQAAEALAIPVGTVMSRLHQGRAQFRTELANTAPPLAVDVVGVLMQKGGR